MFIFIYWCIPSFLFIFFMYPELEDRSLVGMSKFEAVSRDLKVREFDILFRSTLEFSDGNPINIASSSSQEDYDEPRQLLPEEKKEEKCEGGLSSSSSNEDVEESEAARTRILGGGVEVDEDDEGFRTPTSLDHKIPVIKQCPPAPRKPKSSLSTKRKASSSSSAAAAAAAATRRQLVFLDLSQEIESLFPPALLADLGRKIKKARGTDDDTNISHSASA